VPQSINQSSQTSVHHSSKRKIPITKLSVTPSAQLELFTGKYIHINPLAQELNPSAQRCLPRFLLGILIFKGLTARRLCKSFDVKRLIMRLDVHEVHTN
jgi:hypothetical protein